MVLADVFISIDGAARGARSPAYFGYDGPDLQRWISDEQARPQRLVLGRVTYEILSGIPEEARDDGWRSMQATPSLVFSRTLESVDWPNATVVRDDLKAAVRALKDDGGPDLRTVGSLSLVRQLLEAGLVDRLRLMIFPLVLGETGEEPLFSGLPDVGFELVEQSVLDGRIVLCDYRPAGLPPYQG
jgi:dihydrofolate reductase